MDNGKTRLETRNFFTNWTQGVFNRMLDKKVNAAATQKDSGIRICQTNNRLSSARVRGGFAWKICFSMILAVLTAVLYC